MTDDKDPTQEVLRVWDSIASGWERHRQRLFESARSVSDWLVEAISPEPGQIVLELSAGPGETGFLVADRIGPTGRLLSTDLAPAMVDAARRGAEARGLANVEHRVMDAQSMDLPDESVDAVLSRFGLMLMPEPARALSEAHRVLRPNGRLAFAVWGPPDRNPWTVLLGMTLTQLGYQPPGDPFGPGGMFSLAPPGVALDRAAAAGFSGVRVEELPVQQRYESFEEFWDFQREVAGAFALLLRSLPGDKVDRLRSALEEAAKPFQSTDGYTFPGLALGVAASK
jgi:ubiquinone/menaquinone biosynthesis C-methylase UbiE